jgi:hypothetical protein
MTCQGPHAAPISSLPSRQEEGRTYATHTPRRPAAEIKDWQRAGAASGEKEKDTLLELAHEPNQAACRLITTDLTLGESPRSDRQTDTKQILNVRVFSSRPL